MYWNRLRLADAELRDHQRHSARLGFLQRQLHLNFIGLYRLPLNLQFLTGRILQHDAVNTPDALGAKMDSILAPNDQCPCVARSKFPSDCVRIDQSEAGAVVGIET